MRSKKLNFNGRKKIHKNDRKQKKLEHKIESPIKWDLHVPNRSVLLALDHIAFTLIPQNIIIIFVTKVSQHIK